MKSNIILIGALLALISFVAADVSENDGTRQPASEEPVKRVHVLNPGEKEYLSPNLIGVQNIAVTNIPVTMDFINIIDAFREVVDGVKYEIVLNAVNTTDNNTEVVCRLVVLEKPWLTTLWGDKVRLLQESNCTSEELKDAPRDRKTLEKKYETNAIFTGSRNELTADDMFNLESQIIASSNPQVTRQRNTRTTTTEPIVVEPEQVTESVSVVEPTDIQPEADSGVDNSGSSAQEEPIVSTEETATATEKVPELSEDEKQWLDHFLSIGAYNFETSSNQNKNAQSVNNDDQEADKRSRRGLVGGVRELDAQELKLEEESVSKSLSKLATGDGPSYTIVKVYSGTKQVVSGSLTKLDADLLDGKSGETERCTVSLWSQPWLEKDGYEVTFECKDKPKSSHRHSRSIDEVETRAKRSAPTLGGERPLTDAELKEQEKNFSESLSKLAAGDGPKYSLVRLISGTTQVVSGTSTKVKAEITDEATGDKIECDLSLWSQPWLKENGNQITVDCKDKEQLVVTRSKRGGPKGAPRSLNEEELKKQEAKLAVSLAKLASGDGPSYGISKVYSGTKQIVAGTLVKIDAELIDANTGAKENCTVSIWSQVWLPEDGYEVTFECKGKPKTTHRHSRSVEYAQKKSHKKNHRTLNKAEHLFQKFQTKYNKKYHNTMERQMRLRIFKHNLKLIQDLNKSEMGSAKYGITEFADMTTTEYKERTGLLSREESNAVRSQAKIPEVELPKEFDWREKGVITPVKNQGGCGSCWAFSVTGNIEGLHAVKTGKLEEYSEQELLDCDTIDSACQGGLPDSAYQAIEKIGGLELESEYPYEAKKGRCHFNSTLTRVRISGAVDLPKNETAMAQWLITHGPISIGINANAMQFYRGGVSHPWKALCSKGNLDHGVLIVGYGVSDYPMFKKTLPYWIVKNSWGPKWGEQGYYRVYRGDNTCGVSEMATSAILAS